MAGRTNRIWNVYYATRGTSGAYVHALNGACVEAGVPVRSFVSARYRFKTAGVSGVFFPLTDCTNRRNPAILALRWLELLGGYLLVALLAAFRRPVINLHLVDDFAPTWWFFRLCRGLGLRVWVTCHDVIYPGQEIHPRRRRIVEQADRLIVHNHNARQGLVRYFDRADDRRIVDFAYPYSSYDSILSEPQRRQGDATLRRLLAGVEDRPFFLFAGILRHRKGIGLLIEAWKKARCRHDVTLVLAGKWDASASPEVRQAAADLPNTRILDRYLTDGEFTQFVARARFVLLPYLDYGHSAVLVSAARHGSAVICSDIDLFRESMGDYDLMHRSGDADSLAEALDRAAAMRDDEVAARREYLRQLWIENDRNLVDGLRRLRCA